MSKSHQYMQTPCFAADSGSNSIECTHCHEYINFVLEKKKVVSSYDIISKSVSSVRVRVRACVCMYASVYVYVGVSVMRCVYVCIYIYILCGVYGSVGQSKASKPEDLYSIPISYCFSLVFIKNLIHNKSKYKKNNVTIYFVLSGGPHSYL